MGTSCYHMPHMVTGNGSRMYLLDCTWFPVSNDSWGPDFSSANEGRSATDIARLGSQLDRRRPLRLRRSSSIQFREIRKIPIVVRHIDRTIADLAGHLKAGDPPPGQIRH